MPIKDPHRYERFAEHYYALGTATYKNICQSAMAAGYSENYARHLTTKLLGTVGIKNALAKKRKEFESKLGHRKIADGQEILETLTQGLRFRPQGLFDENNNIRSVNDIPDDAAYMLRSIKIKEKILLGNDDEKILDRSTEYQFPDKKAIAVELANLLGLKNGNKEVMDAFLTSIGVINVTVNQQNNYNNLTAIPDGLRDAIDQS